MKYLTGLLGIILIASSLIYAQNWTYEEDFIHGQNPHAVVVDNNGRIWLGFFTFTDTLNSIPVSEIYIYNPDGTQAPFSPIQYLTVNGATDTLIGRNRGLSLDHNGNILAISLDKLYRINYQTGEGMSKIIPNAGTSLTEAACDNNGNIYITHVVPNGLPFYIYDQDFNLINYLLPNCYTIQRSILTSPDGKDVYLGRIYGDVFNNGIIHYQSDIGPTGSYAAVDTIHENIWAQCLDRDRFGRIWMGSYWSVNPGERTGWYCLDPDFGFTIVDSIGHNALDPINGPQPAAGATFYAPRGATWSEDGTTMYTADFDGRVIKKWHNPNPNMIDSIYVSIENHDVFIGDTISIPVNVVFPQDSLYSSVEIILNGFQNKLDFIELDTISSLIGAKGWYYQINQTDSLLMIAAAGSDFIYGSGSLLAIELFVPYTADTGFVPIQIESALFDAGNTPVIINSGRINILPSTIDFIQAENDTAITVQNSADTIFALRNDSHLIGSPLSIYSVSQPVHGISSVNLGDSTVTYNPDTGFSGNDQFSYFVADTMGNQDSAMIFVTIAPLKADLEVSQVQASPQAFSGQQIQISWTISNIGEIGTNAPEWHDRVYLSPSPVFDPQLANIIGTYQNFSYLAPGANTPLCSFFSI